jgi:hypothetical protein
MKLPKSFNLLTPFDRAEIWGEIEEAAVDLYKKGARAKNLSELNKYLPILVKLSKRLQRAQVGEALAKLPTGLTYNNE